MSPNIFKTTMMNGLVMGILFSLNFWCSTSKQIVPLLLSYALIVIIIVLIYRMAVRFRDVDNGGFISYWNVFNFTVLTFFYAAIISTVFKIIYTTYIDTEYLQMVLQESVKQMEQNRSLFEKLGVPMDDNYYEELEKQMKPVRFSLQTIWLNVFSAVIVGLILGGIVKKNKGLFDDEPAKNSGNNEIQQ
jgi:hypothetical protein